MVSNIELRQKLIENFTHPRASPSVKKSLKTWEFPCILAGRLLRLEAGKLHLAFKGLVQSFDVQVKNPVKCQQFSLPLDSLRPGDWVELHLEQGRQEGLEAVVTKGCVVPVSLCLAKEPAKLLQLESLAQWDLFLSEVKSFFKASGFLPLHTPSLVELGSLEPSLESFKVNWVGSKPEMFLPTSPEVSLKRAMTQMSGEDIFEIKKVFRNEPASQTHEPDFFMLEWYECFAPMEALQKKIKDLIDHLEAKNLLKSEKPTFESFKVADLFKKHLNVNLQPSGDQKELLDFCKSKNFESLDKSDCFHWCFSEFIEPKLEGAVFVSHYPDFQAALARLDEAGWALRTEFYWNGLEIGNGFEELLCAEENKKRSFVSGQQSEPWFESLHKGLPPSSGMAVGLERLFMAALGLGQVSQVRLFAKSD